MRDSAAQPRRVTVSLRSSDIERIDALARDTGLNANEIIRRALATESFVTRVRRDGHKLLVEDADGATREIEFVG